MPRNLQPLGDVERAKNFGVRQTWTEGDLETTTVRSDAYVDILSATSTESAKYFMGHGANSRDDANAGYFYVEVHATGAGDGTAGDDIEGVYRFVVYEDSEDEVPVVGPTYDSGDLRDAVSASRTDRPVLPLLVPGAGKDKNIAVQFKAASGSDANVIDGAQTNDDVSVPYTQRLQ